MTDLPWWKWWEAPDGEWLDAGEVQMIPQVYYGDSWYCDGSVHSTRGRRLKDGSWFEVRYWTPPLTSTQGD